MTARKGEGIMRGYWKQWLKQGDADRKSSHPRVPIRATQAHRKDVEHYRDSANPLNHYGLLFRDNPRNHFLQNTVFLRLENATSH